MTKLLFATVAAALLLGCQTVGPTPPPKAEKIFSRFSVPSLYDHPARYYFPAVLRKPEGKGPFPVVIYLHGCNGLSESHFNFWAEYIVSWGYIVVAIDSFTPRGESSVCGTDADTSGYISPGQRVDDVYATRKYLEKLPFVDRKKFAVIGFSHGGATAVRVARSAPPSLKLFDAAVNFYSSCGFYLNVRTPLLTLIGDRDVSHGIEHCKSGVSGNITLVVYPGVYHAFDTPHPGGYSEYCSNGVSNKRIAGGPDWHDKCRYVSDPIAAKDARERVRLFLAKHFDGRAR